MFAVQRLSAIMADAEQELMSTESSMYGSYAAVVDVVPSRSSILVVVVVIATAMASVIAVVRANLVVLPSLLLPSLA